jgi:hypothetical protein
MTPRIDILRDGSEILKPVMNRHGFSFSIDGEGSSSGGNFAFGSWIKKDRKLEYSFPFSLGLVEFSLSTKAIEHEFFLWALSGEKHKAKYPGPSEDPLDGFRRLLDDLNQFCAVFLTGSDLELTYAIRKAEVLKDYWESLNPFKRMEVSVNSENIAVITCPKCNTSKPADMSKYIAIDGLIRFTTSCKCGHSWNAILDKRDKLRKKTNLSGSYTTLTPGKEGMKGVMNILDISRSGIKAKINRMRLKVKDHDLSLGAKEPTFDYEIQDSSDDLDVDDIILVDFELDNVKRSRVSREAVIRWVDLPYVGVEFTSTPILDADLGYYMMSK